MTAAVGPWRATYAPGDSLVLAGPTSLVLLKEPDTSQERLINALWEQVIRSASMTEMAGRLAVFSIDKLPGFAAFFWTERGMRSLVRGDIKVTDPSNGRVVAEGSGIQTWSEVGLAELTRISVTTKDAPQLGPSLPLVVGAANASSVVLDATPEARVSSPQASDQMDVVAPVSLTMRDATADELWGREDEGPDTEPMSAVEVEQQEANQPAAASVPADSPTEDVLESDTALMTSPYGGKPFDPFDPQLFAPQQSPAAQAAMPPPVAPDVETPPPLAATTPLPIPVAAAAEPLPTDSLIMAADCPYGHSNPPAASTCRVCGAQIPSQGPRLVRRPVLCVLSANDGTTVEVDRAVLIGRAPDVSRSTFKAPRLMTLQSPGHDISRTHLEVAPEGWQVVATDLNSTNGTVLVQPDGEEREQLTPGQHVPVRPGSVLELGDGVSITIVLPT